MHLAKKYGKELGRWRIEDDGRTFMVSHRKGGRILYTEQVDDHVWTPWEFRWRLFPQNALVESARSRTDEERIVEILDRRYPNAIITRCV